LRDSEEKPSLLDALDEFSMSMAKAGALLIHYRAHFIKRLCQAAPAIHGDFSGGRERLTLRYETVSTVTDPEAGPQVIFSSFYSSRKSTGRRRSPAGNVCPALIRMTCWWKSTKRPQKATPHRARPGRRLSH